MKSPRTPRGRAALAALAVGGGVAVVAGITGSAAVAGSLGTTIISTITTSDPPPTTAITTVIDPPPPPPPVYKPLLVEKTAHLFYTRVNSWDIDKWASPQAGWDKKDQSVAVDYSVKVTKSWKAVHVRVFGEIAILNPNEAAFLVEVSDELPNAVCKILPPRVLEVDVAAAAAPAPPVAPSGAVIGKVGPGKTLLRYVCTLDGLPKKVVNTVRIRWVPLREATPVEVTAQGVSTATPDWLGTATDTAEAYRSSARYRDINGAVKVIDTLDGDQTRLLDDHLTDSKTFTYRRYLSFWRMKKICRTWENVAKVAPAPRDVVMLPTVDVAPEMRLVPELPDMTPEWPVEEWSKTDSATVKICPPPAPVKGEDPKPPVVEVSGPGDTKTDPVVVKPVDNPKGPVVKTNKTKGRLLVSKFVRGRNVAQVGDIVTWVIKVKNIGKAELYDVKVTDVLPKGLVPVASEAANQNGVVLATIEELAPGDSEVIVVRTLVKGRPAPTPDAIAQTRKLKTSKQRDEAVRRLRRGVICNVARASTKKGPSDSDIACIRIIRKVEVD